MKRILCVLLGLVGVLVGLGIALPALAKLRDYGVIPHCGLLFLGLIIITGGLSGAVYGLVRRGARRT